MQDGYASLYKTTWLLTFFIQIFYNFSSYVLPITQKILLIA